MAVLQQGNDVITKTRVLSAGYSTVEVSTGGLYCVINTIVLWDCIVSSLLNTEKICCLLETDFGNILLFSTLDRIPTRFYTVVISILIKQKQNETVSQL